MVIIELIPRKAGISTSKNADVLRWGGPEYAAKDGQWGEAGNGLVSG